MKKIILYSFFLVASFNSFSQEAVVKPPVKNVQPKIMVVPFAKEGENIRTLIENDVNKRIALSKIKEAFDLRGFTTVDFIGKLKTAGTSAVFNSSNQTDIKSTIISQSGADIYVEAEINYQTSSGGNSINVILQAREISTGNSLSNGIGFSGKFYTDDVAKLTVMAVNKSIDEFLNVMQIKFTEIVNYGKSVIVEIGLDANSKITFANEYKGLPLSDLTEQFFEKNAHLGNYHIQGTTDNKMILDDVKIPLRDPVNGNTYNPNKFSLLLYTFYRELGIDVSKSVVGNTIYITLK
jgi:hypothetical protein